MAKFVIDKDKKGEYRWGFYADNGKLIADSGEGYTTKANCEHGIRVMKEKVAKALIVDRTKNN